MMDLKNKWIAKGTVIEGVWVNANTMFWIKKTKVMCDNEKCFLQISMQTSALPMFVFRCQSALDDRVSLKSTC